MKRLLTHLSCLTRLAMTLVLVLSAMGAWAQTYTVTLKAGAGTGSDIVLNSVDDYYGTVSDLNYAPNGKFFTYGGHLWFQIVGCHDSFTAPDNKMFIGWHYDEITNDFVSFPITGNHILTAYWDNEEFYVDDAGVSQYAMLYRVTSTSPCEVEVKQASSAENGDIIIPATVEHNGNTYTVTSIKNGVFQGCQMKSVFIPAGVRSIGDEAFEGCHNITTLTVAEGSQLASIGDNVFDGCNKLTTITLHSNPYISLAEDFSDEMTLTMTLSANPANGAYWTTFYNANYSFQADKNTKVYKATVSGAELTLHEVTDRIVNSGTAVILKSSGKPVMTLTTGSGEWSANDLWGCNERALCSEILNDFGYTDGTIYVMGKPAGKDMGFYEYTGDYMPANKAFIVLEPSASAPTRGLSFVEEEVTNIEDVTTDNSQQTTDTWYTLSGVKLEGEPTERGVYIHNGRKEVVR